MFNQRCTNLHCAACLTMEMALSALGQLQPFAGLHKGRLRKSGLHTACFASRGSGAHNMLRSAVLQLPRWQQQRSCAPTTPLCPG